jgi:excinuclease ABC subunit C
MVVFTNGIPDKTEYRKFKMRIPGNDDFAHMKEVINRRISPKNVKAWGLPNLFLIDGGKGQLDAALQATKEARLNIPMIGLAKREEEVVVDIRRSSIELNRPALVVANAYVKEGQQFAVVMLPKNSDVVKLLQRVRDESHRFAVSYHSVLKVKRQTASLLDDIPGIGPVTRKKLLRQFGSVKGISQANQADLSKLIGPSKAATLLQYFGTEPSGTLLKRVSADLRAEDSTRL